MTKLSTKAMPDTPRSPIPWNVGKHCVPATELTQVEQSIAGNCGALVLFLRECDVIDVRHPAGDVCRPVGATGVKTGLGRTRCQGRRQVVSARSATSSEKSYTVFSRPITMDICLKLDPGVDCIRHPSLGLNN